VNILEIVRSVANLKDSLANNSELKMGVVPTMGALHKGHKALLDVARKECKFMVATSFVNPLQFGREADLSSYPRSRDEDMTIFEQAGTDLVWEPSFTDVYPDQFETRVKMGVFAEKLEGIYRPNHFDGVATILCKIFNLIRPHMAYFGQKDWQQTRVVQKLIYDLNFDVELRVIGTVRDTDGLAVSSRNRLLLPEQRSSATKLYKALKVGIHSFQHGELDCDILRKKMLDVLIPDEDVRVEYLSIADAFELVELKKIRGPAVFSGAVWIDKVRLIDNVLCGVDIEGLVDAT
tara:strand:+ start:375 stop:1250 length:876 start_codon:yes stop_codon:yes gene_type:complete